MLRGAPFARKGARWFASIPSGFDPAGELKSGFSHMGRDKDSQAILFCGVAGTIVFAFLRSQASPFLPDVFASGIERSDICNQQYQNGSRFRFQKGDYQRLSGSQRQIRDKAESLITMLQKMRKFEVGQFVNV
eukprot:TRINITY_DN16844_c0_g2_i1.p1 TRINITY_DN16844_c0_g2~~TRINITY_DN16844_c0_g2_i1.p1  ORF type:complete len:133 (+),score=26.60 TRINITY_DN16844_c0_g2_i1:478-876(+)